MSQVQFVLEKESDGQLGLNGPITVELLNENKYHLFPL